jgi:hypothetical protein
MEFNLSFNMDNASFDDFPENEICNILDSVKNKIVNGWVLGAVLDVNGNIIGKWSIDE